MIGRHVVVGQCCVLRSTTIGNEAVIGEKCILLEGSVMEDQSVLAPGSVLSPGALVESGQLWAGVPARFVRDLTKDEVGTSLNLQGLYPVCSTFQMHTLCLLVRNGSTIGWKELHHLCISHHFVNEDIGLHHPKGVCHLCLSLAYAQQSLVYPASLKSTSRLMDQVRVLPPAQSSQPSNVLFACVESGYQAIGREHLPIGGPAH